MFYSLIIVVTLQGMWLPLALLHMTFTEMSQNTLTVWALRLGSVLCLALVELEKLEGNRWTVHNAAFP